jgi:hypothetical protein
VVLEDADDDQVNAAAVATRADLMVLGESKPRHGLGSHQGEDVANTAEAVRRIEQRSL